MARFNFKNLDELRTEIDDLGVDLPLDSDFSVLADRVKIGPFETSNRFIVHPMEGFDSEPDGTPSGLSVRRYHRYAVGGAGLIWFEATSVVHEGRSNPGQFYLHEGNKQVFRKLVGDTRRIAHERCGHRPLLVLQLTHSGRYSNPEGKPEPILAHHSPPFDEQFGIPPDYPLATDDYFDRLQQNYVESAKLAVEAGFDAVDVKTCHGYLVSGLLAAHKREGKYGGSYENRTRFAMEVMQRIKDEVSGLLVTTRLNCYDSVPYPYGWGSDEDNNPDLTEPIRLAGELVDWGVEMLNVSIGNPRYRPRFGRPYERQLTGRPMCDEHPLKGIERFVSITRSVQQAVGDVPVIVGALAWLRHFMPYVAAGIVRTGGAALVGQGRGSFAYPDSPEDILEKGRMDPNKCCTTCSLCSQITVYGGHTGCVVRDKEVYAEQFRMARDAFQKRGAQ